MPVRLGYALVDGKPHIVVSGEIAIDPLDAYVPTGTMQVRNTLVADLLDTANVDVPRLIVFARRHYEALKESDAVRRID